MEFERSKKETPEGVAVFFVEKRGDSYYDPLTIIATRRGIRFLGKSEHIEDRKQLDQLARAVADAWKDHESLKPKIQGV